KIVCRKPAGTVTFGRASYSHLLGWSRGLRARTDRSTADVLPAAGLMPGSKAMGVSACLDACRFVRDQTASRTVVDPFCGWGTARLAHLSLPASSLHVGLNFDGDAAVCAALAGDAPAYLLFPGKGAIDVADLPRDRALTLIALDGTWWQARKLLHLNPRLAAL